MRLRELEGQSTQQRDTFSPGIVALVPADQVDHGGGNNARNIGVDTLQVRRNDAPPRKAYARGLLSKAGSMLRSRVKRTEGKRLLIEDRFAPTTRAAMAARTLTIMRLIRDAGVNVTPINVDSYNLVAAALKAGGYRSGAAYLRTWEALHKEAGFDWTYDLAAAKVLAKRSIERGMGPCKRASTVDLEKVVRYAGDPNATDMVIIGAMRPKP